VRDLTKRFGATTALAGMSWAARHGQVTAVLGPNGAGKTTTIECAEGLQRPDAGEVRVLGADPWRAGPDHRAAVGVMLQDGGLPNSSTPLRLLRHLASFHQSPADVGSLVERLGIAAFSGTTVRRLSGGQRQRPPPSSADRRLPSWTSRPPAWTRTPGWMPGTCFARPGRLAAQSSSRPTPSRRPSGWPTTSSSSTVGASPRRAPSPS
jgi:hypothetical protein